MDFGVAAHSYFNNIRYSNTENLLKYIENCEKEKFILNKILQEKQNQYTQEQEYMLLGLRKIEGISIQNFKNKFGENPVFIFRNELHKLVQKKLIIITENNIKLTNKGLDLANLVWEEFI